jgi:hypothetical protein
MDTICSLTKYGEKRIRNCRKYDLGYGYRLITLLRGKTVFIPFLGSHDECQRWLENNKRIKKITAGKGITFPISEKNSTKCNSSYDPPEDYYEDEISMDLNEQDLRIVFSGLVEGVKKRLR